MLYFILGLITGILIAVLVVATLIFFKSPIKQYINIIEKKISNAGPRPRGFVSEPMSDNELTREEILKENGEKGIDTPIKDLN